MSQTMPETMSAAVFKGKGRLEIEERPVPQLQGDDEVILEVGGVGICGSDLHIIDRPEGHPAKLGVIMGHEFAGRVATIGKGVKGLKPGDHVVVDPNPGCGKCKMCVRGFPNACIPLFTNPESPLPGFGRTPGMWWDGAMAKFVRMPAHHLHPISKHVPMWQAALFEPIGVIMNGMSKINFQVGESAVVLGAGPIGLLFVAMFKAAGASKVMVSDPAPRRRKVALACGADVVIDPNEEDVRQRVLAETNDDGADVSVEAVGWVFPLAVELVRFSGRVLVVGTQVEEVQFSPHSINSKELQIFGVFLMQHAMEAAVSILETGLLPLNQIVTHRLPLERVHEGLDLVRSGEAAKVVLEPIESA